MKPVTKPPRGVLDPVALRRVCTVVVTLVLYGLSSVATMPPAWISSQHDLVGIRVAGAQERRCASAELASHQKVLEELDATDTYRRAHRFATGAGVRVAVIDTGVAAHPGLGHITEAGDFVSEGSHGPTDDCDAHGTIVAGVIAANGTDAASGLIGVAPGAHVITIKQTSALSAQDPQGTLDTLAQAILRALEHDARVINISVVSCVPPGQSVDDALLSEALGAAEAAQAVVVAAAGNESHACAQGHQVFPAHMPTVVAVRSLAHPYFIAEYALSSPNPTLAARGDLHAALHPGGTGIAEGIRNHDGVSPFVGTSFAAPVVSGTVALMLERDPDASAQEIRQRLFAAADPATGAVDPAVVLGFYLAPQHANALDREAAQPQPVALSASPEAVPARVSVALWWLLCAAALLGVFAGASAGRSTLNKTAFNKVNRGKDSANKAGRDKGRQLPV